MEKFLLNFTNTFRELFYHEYKTCIEFRAGYFMFDYWRPLPQSIVSKLNLIEHTDYDDEMQRWITCYEPNFKTI